MLGRTLWLLKSHLHCPPTKVGDVITVLPLTDSSDGNTSPALELVLPPAVLARLMLSPVTPKLFSPLPACVVTTKSASGQRIIGLTSSSVAVVGTPVTLPSVARSRLKTYGFAPET